MHSRPPTSVSCGPSRTGGISWRARRDGGRGAHTPSCISGWPRQTAEGTRTAAERTRPMDDLRYTCMDSPIGELLLVAGDAGLRVIRFAGSAPRPEWRADDGGVLRDA